MPGAGKSTIGIILAKNLGLGFIDTDVLIQINQQKTLQQIMDESNHLNLREIEEREILKINVKNHVIATGGSAVYSKKAMAHLASLSIIIYLKLSYGKVKERIDNFETRGIAKAPNQTFRELYEERQHLYDRYADVTIDCNMLNQDKLSSQIACSLANS